MKTWSILNGYLHRIFVRSIHKNKGKRSLFKLTNTGYIVEIYLVDFIGNIGTSRLQEVEWCTRSGGSGLVN